MGRRNGVVGVDCVEGVDGGSGPNARTQAIQCVSPLAAYAQPMLPYDRSDRIASWPGLPCQLATADRTGFGIRVLV